MLMAYDLGGQLTDLANQAYQNAAAAANAAGSPSTSPVSPVTGTMTDILDVAKTAAAAEKRKATWLLVGVGVGALIVGVLLGRYAIPSRTRS